MACIGPADLSRKIFVCPNATLNICFSRSDTISQRFSGLATVKYEYNLFKLMKRNVKDAIVIIAKINKCKFITFFILFDQLYCYLLNDHFKKFNLIETLLKNKKKIVFKNREKLIL